MARDATTRRAWAVPLVALVLGLGGAACGSDEYSGCSADATTADVLLVGLARAHSEAWPASDIAVVDVGDACSSATATFRTVEDQRPAFVVWLDDYPDQSAAVAGADRRRVRYTELNDGTFDDGIAATLRTDIESDDVASAGTVCSFVDATCGVFAVVETIGLRVELLYVGVSTDLPDPPFEQAVDLLAELTNLLVGDLAVRSSGTESDT